MFNSHDVFGAETFKTWNEDQRREEIGKLVAGYRNGLPLVVLCKMAESIAGSREQSKTWLAEFLTLEERELALAAVSPAQQQALKDCLL